MLRRITQALAIAALLVDATAASAFSISPAAFSAARVVENFEGVLAGSNVSTSAYGNILLPGSTGNYSFASGATLRGPNPGLFSNGAFLHNLALGGASNNWGANGTVNNAAQVPDVWGLPSTTYLGAFDNLSAGSTSLEFTFTTALLRVGAWVAGGAGTTITLEVYSTSGALLESRTIAAPSVAAWGSSFLGIERSEGIGRVVFRGADFGLDGLSFEAGASVPEPSRGLLSLVGIGSLWAMRRRAAPR